MKTRLSLLIAGLLLLFSTTSYAWWGNNGWGGWNPYPVWTPMYWAEEMFDGNDYGPYGYGPYGYPGYGYGPYGYPGYGYRPYGYPGGWGGPGWW
ncbi:MAG: hypothetical protein OEY87_09535 [Gammaproteobacteria bacterium]|nr:hypothetical protein [Gammaproteobacteria bacterium]MDH5736350.1 hypothetical protein [Gammaproteobacteria bacterium]